MGDGTVTVKAVLVGAIAGGRVSWRGVGLIGVDGAEAGLGEGVALGDGLGLGRWLVVLTGAGCAGFTTGASWGVGDWVERVVRSAVGVLADGLDPTVPGLAFVVTGLGWLDDDLDDDRVATEDGWAGSVGGSAVIEDWADD